jgi:hypothetical protein
MQGLAGGKGESGTNGNRRRRAQAKCEHILLSQGTEATKGVDRGLYSRALTISSSDGVHHLSPAWIGCKGNRPSVCMHWMMSLGER